VTLLSPPLSQHLSRVLSELHLMSRGVLSELHLMSRGVISELRLMSRGVLTRTRWVLSCTRLVLQNYTSRKI
jgi:hypothetical protein